MRIAAAFALLLLVAGAAQAARITGTARSDRLTGTPRADTISGLEGRDRLTGLGGTDFLHGGVGRDVLDAGSGSDRISVEYDGSRDIVRCGPGSDVVNADLPDSVAADCELVGRRLSRDPYTGPEAQHESEVEPDSLTVGRTTVVTFQVGRRFGGAADNVGFATSSDDGGTWRSGLLPGLTRVSQPAGPHERASDPVVAYDAVHRVWLISTLALEGQVTRLPVSRSTDGLTWEAPVIAAEGVSAQGISIDKNWIACDNGPASPFRGRCYIAYTDALRQDRIAVVSSTDGGLTWSAPVGIPVTSAVGAFPVIQPDGTLVVVFLWEGRRLGASVSSDGGAIFGPPATIAEIQVRSIRGLRFFPLPSADVDPSGRVWVTWHDCRFTAGCSTNSVTVATSVDGRTWTPPARVTSGRNAFLPAIGIHPTNGRLAAVYHVVRPGGGIDVELVEFRAGGGGGRPSGVTAPRRLSAQTMRPEWMPDTVSGRMLTDYLSVHYAGARPLVAWILASQPAGGELRQAVYATRG
jgi:RTX calcium-binding nonapeptide repeat (4 copies)